jgi:flagellar protein FlgJ
MDIGAIGTQYIDNARFTTETLGIARQGSDTPVLKSSFGELLENAQGNETSSTPDSAASNSHKPKIDKTDKLYEQCEALETFLVKTLVTGMRNTVQKSGLVDEGFAGKMYEDMLYDEYAKDMTKNAGFGLADLAYLELTGQRGKLISEHF